MQVDESWGKMVILNPEVLNELDNLEPAVKRAVASLLAEGLMETQRKIMKEQEETL